LKEDVELTAAIEPFDTFWEAPRVIERGYASFGTFYRRNYGRYLPEKKDARILVVSCGPGYFLKVLAEYGYRNVLGIDSDPRKVEYAKRRGLACRVERAFPFLGANKKAYDFIFVEQEINHLTKQEILAFLGLCRDSLDDGGELIVHSLNGANPITGSEALAQNFDHYNTFTEYSLRQVLGNSGFGEIKVFPLNLYVFYGNPLNYVGLAADAVMTFFFRLSFKFYGKENRIFTKKIAAACRKRSEGG